MTAPDGAPRWSACPAFPVRALGVGRSWCSTWSASVGPCPPARRFTGSWEPPFTASCAVGVFSSIMARASSGSARPRLAAFSGGVRSPYLFTWSFQSVALGVGSSCAARQRGACPFPVIPFAGSAASGLPTPILPVVQVPRRSVSAAGHPMMKTRLR